MQSTRPDVQRMALKKETLPEDKKAAITKELEDVLYGDMLRLGVGFVPVAGDAADIYELLQGKDFISGQELNWNERLLSGVGIVIGSGAGYRYALRAIRSPSAYIPEFQKGISQSFGKSSSLTQQGLEGAGNILRQAKEAVENLKQSPALKRFFRSQQFTDAQRAKV